MRITRNVAFVMTALCLVFAVVSMLGSTSLTFTAGSTSTVDCGSAAFPKSLDDFASADDAANCAGQTTAGPALIAVLLAGLGLGVLGVTSRGVGVDQVGHAAERSSTDASSRA